ncbi:MAG: YbaB/EbfC family nucleoid-associated protein [Candidatus Omnitrophota bacterium]|nr:YbaB/EbfC family nucleoid-associated protein [Candidatus Omnitrophota bacterium]
MFDKMKQLFELQGKMQAVKKELENSSVESQSRGGDIKIVIRGDQKVSSINIADSLLSPENKALFERDLVNCFNEAIKKSQGLAAEKMKQVTGINLPGF